SGPVVAGVIGKKKFNYDVWGSTVNIASRMESNSEGGKILVSEETYSRLRYDYEFDGPHIINDESLGEIRAYFLTGRKAARK
ncbi:MAG: adenylate/guanylate cyclase, partial [Pyrinomonadaceae bacterium]|nr:adenylate/guanylate cyclase [Pyrinomonadaceae bacterium]